MKIINPLSPNKTEEDIKTVLNVLAGQGGCDGEPYDQIQQPVIEYKRGTEMKIDKWMKALYLKYKCNDEKLIFELSEKVCELSKQIDRMKNCGTCKYNTMPEREHKCKACVKKGRGKYADWKYGL